MWYHEALRAIEPCHSHADVSAKTVDSGLCLCLCGNMNTECMRGCEADGNGNGLFGNDRSIRKNDRSMCKLHPFETGQYVKNGQCVKKWCFFKKCMYFTFVLFV